MISINLTVSLATIRAARTHAADKDIRYYLNGIFLDTVAGKIVSTDGHRLFIAPATGVRHGRDMSDAIPAIRTGVIVPNDAIDAALKLYAGEFARGKPMGACDVTITLEWDTRPDPDRPGVRILGNPVGRISVPNGGHIGFSPVDGKFPEWRRVIPRAEQLGAVSFAGINPQYLADAMSAIAIARNVARNKTHPVGVWMRGEGVGIVTDEAADIMVAVMPMRTWGFGDTDATRAPFVSALIDAATDTPVPAAEPTDAA
jgi:hypothetical protein